MNTPWISVKDRLPETGPPWGDSDYVLCIAEDSPGAVVCWFNRKKNKWTLCGLGTHNNPVPVTHWMPIPKLP